MELGHVSRLGTPDQSVDLVTHSDVVLPKFAHESVFAHLAAHVALDGIGHAGLVLVRRGVTHALAVLLNRAPVVNDVEGRHGRGGSRFIRVKGAHLLLDFGELCVLGIL